ncbi:fungal-specific transcription factor domain-containing protein [Collybia nuda]|uniref:Fungal-specific transcription factor domain-containing protein n=1 Tax=Collybia nuda TaxID=64659 RepID=A0A9P5XX33_9AGAR|nr:fungal-specific transcription factor domain-containing protein [Collybia nuda]
MPIPILRESLFHFSNRTDDSDSVEEHEEHSRQRLRPGPRTMPKSSGACVHCKSLKVKCEFAPGETTCQRCQAGNYQCLARSRKKRKPAPTHEDLQERAHNQDVQIQALLLKFDELRAKDRIEKWKARAATLDTHEPTLETKNLRVEKPRWNGRNKSAEYAVASYFSPAGKGLNDLSAPDIVKYCALQPEDIMDLFTIFFERINPYFSILDPEMHTPSKLIWTCPFLFTVICAVSSRYYTGRPTLYPLAMDLARDAAGRALIDGSKSVDVCQAYLLMAVYPVPKKKWTEDRSWLLMGVAIRMAIELELNQPPPAICSERESLNRTRTWLNCYCVDGSHAIQFGKMPMLRLDDYLARNSRQWYKSSPLNIPFDIHLCAYVHIIILVAEWRSLTGHNLTRVLNIKDFDVVISVMETEEKLAQELAMWVEAYAEEYIALPLAICAYRGNTTQMITSYLRLVVLAVGFQHSAKTGLSRDSPVVNKSIHAAREVIQIMVERLYPTGNLRFAMEANFLYVSFAAAFLINLLRPRFLHLLNENGQNEIVRDVHRLIEVLGSRDVALDGRHTPALYSRFLSSLLDKHTGKNQRTFSSTPSSDNDDTNSPHRESHQSPQSYLYSWPDIIHPNSGSHENEMQASCFYNDDSVDVDMDFGLSHFVRTVTEQDLSPTQTPGGQITPQEWNNWGPQTEQVQWPPIQPNSNWRPW